MFYIKDKPIFQVQRILKKFLAMNI